MSAPQERQSTRHDTGLSPEAAALVDTYFARVHGALLVAAADECEEAVADLRTHVLDELAAGPGTPADVTRVLAELGPPEALAAQCADVASEQPQGAPDAEKRSPFSGTLLGVPYELRPPSASRVASRWWDPLNPHVIVPRVFGIGWTINLGALAVLLGLVRPDDEDEPFAEVPERWLVAALFLPLVVAGVLVVLIALFQSSLPALVPIHWGLAGPDQYGDKSAALVLPLLMTGGGLAFVAWTWALKRSALQRVAAGAGAAALASISLGVYCQHIASAHGSAGTWFVFGGIAAGILLPFALLVTLARVGRAVEQRRDLEKTSKKGSV